MKLPEFEIGDAVMLQTGSRHMTITEINRAAQVATCVQFNDHRQEMVETKLPLRCLIRLSEKIESLSPGDLVANRATWQYMSVLSFDTESGLVACKGKTSTELIPVEQLLRISVTYDK